MTDQTRKRRIEEVEGEINQQKSTCKKVKLNQTTDKDEELPRNALIVIQKIFKMTKFDTQKRFIKESLALITKQKKKLEQIEFNETAKKKILRTMKKYQNTSNRYRYYVSIDKETISNIYTLTDKILIHTRNYVSETTPGYEKGMDEPTDVHKSMEVALRSNNVHPEYTKIINDLFDGIFNNKDISSIISEYSWAGYRWYRFRIIYNVPEYVEFETHNYSGMMFKLPFDIKDYFCDDIFDHNHGLYSGTGIKLEELRTDLNVKELNEMDDFATSVCMMGICDIGMEINESRIEQRAKKFCKIQNRNTKF